MYPPVTLLAIYPQIELSRLSKAFWIVVLLILSGSAAYSQKSSAKLPSEPKQLEVDVAVRLLNELLAATRMLDDPALKVRIQARIADAIWPFDEPRARSQFFESFRTIDEITPDRLNSARNLQKETEIKARLRDDVIALVSLRDLRLAQELIALATKAQPETKNEESVDDVEQEKALRYMDSAINSVDTDPQGAMRLAQDALSVSGDEAIYFKLSGLLERLSSKDRRLADDLFTYALTSAAQDPSQSASKFALLADYVFPGMSSSRSAFSANLSSQTKSNGNVKQDALIRRFLSTVASVLTRPHGAEHTSTSDEDDWNSSIRASHDYELVRQLLPYFDQYLPEQASLVRSRLGDLHGQVPYSKSEQLTDSSGGDVRDLLRAAENVSNQSAKDALYVRAWNQLLQERDYDLAYSVCQKIADKGVRERFESSTWFLAANSAIGREEFETAYQYIERVTNCKDRATIFSNLATAHHSKKHIERAMGILDEAHASIGKCEDGLEKVRGLLIIVDAASRIDVRRAFAVLQSLVGAINKVEARTEFAGSEAMQPGTTMLNLDFSKGITELARADFDRTVLLAQSIERKDVSAFIQIALCREKLAKLKERGLPPK